MTFRQLPQLARILRGRGGGVSKIRACPYFGKCRNLRTVPYISFIFISESSPLIEAHQYLSAMRLREFFFTFLTRWVRECSRQWFLTVPRTFCVIILLIMVESLHYALAPVLSSDHKPVSTHLCLSAVSLIISLHLQIAKNAFEGKRDVLKQPHAHSFQDQKRKGFFFSFEIFQHTSHNAGIFRKNEYPVRILKKLSTWGLTVICTASWAKFCCELALKHCRRTKEEGPSVFTV